MGEFTQPSIFRRENVHVTFFASTIVFRCQHRNPATVPFPHTPTPPHHRPSVLRTLKAFHVRYPYI